jgi:O-antigen/teichoic acid export membrane protein
MTSVAAVGAYNRAWTLGRRLQELNWRIAEMLLPTLAQRWGAGDTVGFERVLFDTLRYSAVGMLLIGAAGGGSAPGIMELFGGGFDQASAALAIILLMPALQTLSTLQSQALVAQDRPLATTYAAGGRVAATVIATVAFVPVAGVTGAALGMIIGSTVDLVWKTVLVLRTINARLRDLWPVRNAVGLGAAYVAAFLTARPVEVMFPGFAGVALGLILGSLVYFTVVILVGGMTPDDRRRLKDVSRAIRARRGTRPSAEAASA